MSKHEKAGKLTRADITSMGLMQTPILGAIYTGSNAVESFASGQPVKATLEAALTAVLVAAPRAAKRLIRRTAEVGLSETKEGMKKLANASFAEGTREGIEIGTLASELQHHPEMPRAKRQALEAELAKRLRDVKRGIVDENDTPTQTPSVGSDQYDGEEQPGIWYDDRNKPHSIV